MWALHPTLIPPGCGREDRSSRRSARTRRSALRTVRVRKRQGIMFLTVYTIRDARAGSSAPEIARDVTIFESRPVNSVRAAFIQSSV